MNKQKILVTGGCGYIGSIITGLLLQQGYRVRAVDILWFKKDIPLIYMSDPDYEFIRADICDYSLMKKLTAGVDYIIHAAAVVGEPACKAFSELTRKTNYEASLNLFESAKESNAKGVIFLSTCSNYGTVNNIANEDTELKILSLYAETKVGVERYLMNKADGLNWVIMRLSTVYGTSPRMRFDLTVNDFTMNAYKNKRLDIFLPFSYRPYMHVYDAASAIVEVVKNFDRVKYNIFNVGYNEENYQKIRIAEIVKRFLPETKIEVVKSGRDLRDYRIDFSKLQKHLKVGSNYNVESGVKEIIDMLQAGLIDDPDDNIYYNTRPNLTGRIKDEIGIRCT